MTVHDPAIAETLRHGVPLFAGLSEEAFARALALARPRGLPRDGVLFRQGEPAAAFHLLLSGRLKVGQTTPEGQQVIIRYLGPREIAGCVAVCGGLPYPATATAVEDCRLLTWSRERIAELARRYPEIALNAMREMGGRTTELQERLKELQTQRVEQRVAHALARLVLQAGRRTGAGIEIDFPISRQDLAEMTGTTLHSVSRTLSAWDERGIVAAGRQKVVIREPQLLLAIAETPPAEGA